MASHSGAEDHHPNEVEPEGDHDHGAHPPHGSLANVGAKLQDPLSDLWSIAMNLQGPTFFDGDLNTGDAEIGSSLVFQPVLPIPLYGEGAKEWRLITRPVLPIVFAQPVSKFDGTPGDIGDFGEFKNVGGLGDMQLPLLPVPPCPRGRPMGCPRN